MDNDLEKNEFPLLSVSFLFIHLLQELLRSFSIDVDALAEIYPSMHAFGKIRNGSAFENIPICSVSVQSNLLINSIGFFLIRFVHSRLDNGKSSIIIGWTNVL